MSKIFSQQLEDDKEIQKACDEFQSALNMIDEFAARRANKETELRQVGATTPVMKLYIEEIFIGSEIPREINWLAHTRNISTGRRN